MTNFEKLKSLVEADDKAGVASFLVDHSLLVMVDNGNFNELKFLDDEYNERRVESGIISLLERIQTESPADRASN